MNISTLVLTPRYFIQEEFYTWRRKCYFFSLFYFEEMIFSNFLLCYTVSGYIFAIFIFFFKYCFYYYLFILDCNYVHFSINWYFIFAVKTLNYCNDVKIKDQHCLNYISNISLTANLLILLKYQRIFFLKTMTSTYF